MTHTKPVGSYSNQTMKVLICFPDALHFGTLGALMGAQQTSIRQLHVTHKTFKDWATCIWRFVDLLQHTLV